MRHGVVPHDNKFHGRVYGSSGFDSSECGHEYEGRRWEGYALLTDCKNILIF